MRSEDTLLRIFNLQERICDEKSLVSNLLNQLEIIKWLIPNNSQEQEDVVELSNLRKRYDLLSNRFDRLEKVRNTYEVAGVNYALDLNFEGVGA